MIDTTIGRLVRAASMATVMAIVLVTIVLLFARAFSGDLLVDTPGSDELQEITVGAAMFSTVLGGIVGAAIAATVWRFARRPRLTFLAVTIVLSILYSIVPFRAADDSAAALWLVVMHVVVAVPVIGALTRELPAERA